MSEYTFKRDVFSMMASKISQWSGRPGVFIMALSAVVVWGICGPVFDYSDTWQLIINTSTTIITFLMVFLIQNSQNRDTKALQLKLDELIRTTKGAHTILLDLEELSEEQLTHIQKKYEQIAQEGRKRLKAGQKDTAIPNVNLDVED